jgi:AraC-like DNA-binding protein
MQSLSGFFNIIILLGAIQGFIISSLLYFSHKHSIANRLLAVLIFFIALACLNLYLANQDWYNNMPAFSLLRAVVPMVIVMPLGPLLFFYTKASLDPEFKITRKDKRHFIPVIIDLFPYLTAISFIITFYSGLMRPLHFDVGLFIDNYNVYSDIPRWVSLTLYLVLSVRYIGSFRKKVDAAKMTYQLKWMRQLTIAFIIFQSIWLAYLIPYVLPVYSDKLMQLVNWYPIYIPMSFLIYWLGIKGYLVTQHQAPAKRSAMLPAAISERTIAALKNAMEADTLYLDPELSLNLLAQYTGIPPKTISAVLNQHLNTSFNEFVNEYRVSAFKQKLCTDAVKHLTIAGIAAECGFSSQATFQRSFKQLTGLSPSEFKLRALQS